MTGLLRRALALLASTVWTTGKQAAPPVLLLAP